MSDSDLPFLIYLLMFLALLGGSYVASSRTRFSQSIQYIAIWVLIFFGFLAVYGMRDSLQEQLYPEKITVARDGSYVFQRAEDGHFYTNLEIEGVQLTLALDTGATRMVLTKEDAAKLGYDLDKLRFSQTALTANGVVASAPITLKSIKVGQTEINNVRASVNGGELHSSLMGMAFINRFSEIKIVKDLLYLTP